MKLTPGVKVIKKSPPTRRIVVDLVELGHARDHAHLSGMGRRKTRGPIPKGRTHYPWDTLLDSVKGQVPVWHNPFFVHVGHDVAQISVSEFGVI